MKKKIYVSEKSYKMLIAIGLEELAYQKPRKKSSAWYSESAGCWLDQKVFKKIWKMKGLNNEKQ